MMLSLIRSVDLSSVTFVTLPFRCSSKHLRYRVDNMNKHLEHLFLLLGYLCHFKDKAL